MFFFCAGVNRSDVMTVMANDFNVRFLLYVSRSLSSSVQSTTVLLYIIIFFNYHAFQTCQ